MFLSVLQHWRKSFWAPAVSLILLATLFGSPGLCSPAGSKAQRPVTQVQLQPQEAKLDPSGIRPPLKAGVNHVGGFSLDAETTRVLARYNVELIIDRSMSMRKRDCPGGLSRWDWCAEQVTSIANSLAPYSPHGQTITRFATDFDVHENASAREFQDLFSRHDFQFGTCMAEPLAQRLDNFFAHHRATDKPTLIVVITDGVPAPRPQPRLVRDELVDASYRIQRPGEVTVVFLQVGGDDWRGRNFLLSLGNDLVAMGGRYQFVKTRTFDELQNVGLAHAIVQSVQQYGQRVVQPARSQSASRRTFATTP